MDYELKYSSLSPDTWKALQELKREGWIMREVQDPESVQEHIVTLREFAASLFDELANYSDKDKQDLLDMLEVHDWPEAFIGDLVILTEDPEEKKKLKEEKYQREKDALKALCATLGEKGDEVFDLWLRFEEGDDKVAVLARQIDKYQALEKAWEYEEAQGISGLAKEFITFSQKYITDPILLKRLDDLKIKAKI